MITVHFNKFERKILTSYAVFRHVYTERDPITCSLRRTDSERIGPSSPAWRMLGSRSVRARLTVHEMFTSSMLVRYSDEYAASNIDLITVKCSN